METSVKITLIIVSALLIMVLAGGYTFYNIVHPYQPGKTIQVQGISTIKANPDIVTVYLTVETIADDTGKATQDNSEIVDNILTDLVKAGFERKQIITEGFNVGPNNVWRNNNYFQDGYKATHNIKVELSTSETSKIGEVIDIGAEYGAYVNYINFELSQEKQNEYKAQALKEASEDAKTKATAMAEGLDMSIGKLISVTSQDYSYYPWRYYDYGVSSTFGENLAAVKQAATDIQPGEREITAQVLVVYSLR